MKRKHGTHLRMLLDIKLIHSERELWIWMDSIADPRESIFLVFTEESSYLERHKDFPKTLLKLE